MDTPTKEQIVQAIQPKGPALVLGLGSLLWKLASLVSNIDFILSLREGKVAVFFQFLLNWGWILLPVLALLWGLTSRDTRTTHGGMTFSVGVISFLFGALLVTYATQTDPQLITGWGNDPNASICNIAVDTSRLNGFADHWRIVGVCGVNDSTIDQMEDGRIAISTTFHITGGPVPISVPFSDALSQAAKSGKYNGMWYAILLIPEDEDMTRIKKLSEAKKDGGRIFHK
jgi:hypothetical protein